MINQCNNERQLHTSYIYIYYGTIDYLNCKYVGYNITATRLRKVALNISS